MWLLKKLKPKRYHKNGEHGWYMGFVAQDVEEAIRNTQMQDCDLYHDGGKDGYASLCYEELIAPLVQGWQEHEKKMA